MNEQLKPQASSFKLENRLSSVVCRLWFVACGLLLLTCGHGPLGFDQLDRDLRNPQFPATPFVAGDCYGTFIANGPGSSLYLGKDRAYESRVLLRFALQDSALDSVTAVSLVLYPQTLHPVSFSIHPTTTEWDDYQATWHDAESGIPWFRSGGDFDTTLLARPVVTADSTVIDLDQARLRTMVDQTYGIILIPDTAPAESLNFCNLYSMSTTGKMPKVVIKYGTTTRTYEATENAFIVDTLALTRQISDFWAGAGYAFRTYLKFNVDSVESTATVVTAELKLRVDTVFSLHDTLHDTVVLGVHRLTADYALGGKDAPFDGNVLSSCGYILGTDSLVSFDLRSLVQLWAEKPDSNFGLLVTMDPENADISRVQFSSKVLPTLRVANVSPPEGRF
jgi:hypothetical protein